MSIATGGPARAHKTRSQKAERPACSTISGYRVHATDGPCGYVDPATDRIRSRDIVVASRRILGFKVLVPVEAVVEIDHGRRIVYLDQRRRQLRDAPLLDSRDYR